MDRRALLAATLAAGGGAALPAWAQPPAAPAGPSPDAVKALARDAYLFALPLLEVCRTRDNALAAGATPNHFNHRVNLAGPADRGVTTPNNDTLYSVAFLDLRKGPVNLAWPETGKRYFSLALMDAWSNNFHIAGTRTDGGKDRIVMIRTLWRAGQTVARQGYPGGGLGNAALYSGRGTVSGQVAGNKLDGSVISGAADLAYLLIDPRLRGSRS